MSIYQTNELTCKPLDTYNEILMFLQNPPAWRSLCKELIPHSEFKIKNSESNKHEGVSRTMLDGPESFCHFDPDAPEPERVHEKSLPKTLVCHDMANGYHDDSIIDGTCNYDAYTFYNWAGVDIFCYFSHHLITIPPLGWINVGHDHGVKVIGTVITEWADGMEFWDKILESEEEYKNFASALVAIAKTLKFDGWLLNVENKITKPDALLAFVRHLHTLLHQEVAGAELIWYDSVTVEGHLNWQNALNHKNRAFFDACDGFFTNYSWAPGDVEASAREAGARLSDLYIGIDVWGRNFYGGGQFNIQEAVELAHSHGCSLAVFAPAWTHEALTLDRSDANVIALSDDLDAHEHFLLRDRALWDSVWRYFNTRLPCQLPFKTSFCRGQGLTRRLYGEVISPGSWYNLRHQQYQPNASHGVHGYLLSTLENILNASRTGVLKDPKGIIKYREAQPTSQVAVTEEHKSQEDLGIVPHADSVGELAEEPPEPSAERAPDNTEVTEKPKLTLKRKMKNVFKHIFHHQKTKKADDNREDDERTAENSKEVDKRENQIENNSQQLENNSVTESNTAQKRDSKIPKLEVIPEQASEQELADGNKPNVSESFTKKNPEAQRELAYKAKSEEQLAQKAIAEPLHDEEPAEDEYAASTGQSMVRMSINIQLKDKEQRTRYGLACVPDELQCLEVLYEDSFIGGSCLQVNPSNPHSRDVRHIRILHCDFPCEDSLIFCVVTKHVVGYEDQFLNVKVFMRDEDGRECRMVLVGRDVAQALHSARSAGFITSVAPVGVAAGAQFRALQAYLLLHQPGFYVPVENSYGWHVRYYEINLPQSRVTSINCDTGLSHGPILLGYLGVCHRNGTPENNEEM